MQTFARAVTIWPSLAGLYLFFAGSLGLAETIASVVCATAGTALALGQSRIALRRFAGHPPRRAFVRPVTALVPETFAVGRQLVIAILSSKNQCGAYVRQDFEPGGDDPASAGRRAAVVLGVSIAPGSFVIRGEQTDTMILHALPQKAASPDRVWPA